MKTRFLVLVFAIAVGYFSLFLKLYNIQISKGDYYLARAQSQYIASDATAAKRGAIYFSDKANDKFMVAVERETPVIYAVPKIIDDPAETYNRLREIISGLPPVADGRFSEKTSKYFLLKKNASQSEVDKIVSEGIKGIFVGSEPSRFYPSGPFASHILGFVGPNSDNNGESGKYGLEKFYENSLAGVPGSSENGKLIQSKDGEDLILTIDQNIQKQAETVLAGLVEKNRAKGGAFIVEEPSTGRILAMGGYPDFDPNNYSGTDYEDFLNPAIQKIYEPGSVIKVLTMAAGIDAGKITPDTTYIDKGFTIINGKRIENSDFKTRGAHGLLTMTNVLEKSLNLGAIFAESKIGNETFRDYLVKFGLRDKTGIDLPGEVSGSLKPLFASYLSQVNFATASFGQGIAVTPIELIAAIASIANGGEMMRPYLNAALTPKPLGRPVSASAADSVTKMMISAVDKAGVANMSGYSIAGKTGTAYVVDSNTKSYDPNRLINTFVGFGPTSDPRFILLIKLDEPEGSPFAALTVVPAFRELAQFILNYYNVPPDRL